REPQALHPDQRQGREVPRHLMADDDDITQHPDDGPDDAADDVPGDGVPGDGVPGDDVPGDGAAPESEHGLSVEETIEAISGGGVEPIEIEREMEQSFLDYAMSVLVSRALPDARDGLKPVHRRILWGMFEQN